VYFLRIYLRKYISCGISCGFICGIKFLAEFPTGFNAELLVDYSQERLLQLHSRFRQKIPQESFLQILKTAGNNYPQRF
jgi:hypothetical protein